MIKLVVDCTCEIDVKEAASLGITCLPMRIILDDQEFMAGENLDNATFYNLLSKAKSFPKTMQINPDDYLRVLQPMLDAGDEVFVMAISSGLSGTFNSLKIASEQLNNPKLRIFDTETYTIGYYALVMEALKMIQAGTTLDALEKRLTELRKKVKIYCIVDTLKYMIKGGRINCVKGLLAEYLHFKPIVGVVDKKLGMVAKSFGYNAAKRQLVRLAKNIDTTLPVYYGHVNASEKAEDIKQIFPDLQFVCKREIGPIIGAHGGPGCVGLSFFEK